MTDQIYNSYPPELSDEQKDYLVQVVKDWSIHHSLTYRPHPSFVSDEINKYHTLATNAPITLFPSPFPKSCFDQAKDLQTVYNELYAAIADDEEWLEEMIQDVLEDDFMFQLWRIHQAVKKEGYVQDLSLGLFRSDYMLHVPDQVSTPTLKQVEINTISASFGGLAAKVGALHTELATFPTPAHPLAYPAHPLLSQISNSKDNKTSSSSSPSLKTTGVPPPNPAMPTLAAGLLAAHKAYGISRSNPPLPLGLVILVQDNERNTFDQLEITAAFRAIAPDVPFFRLPISTILARTTIPNTTDNAARPLLYIPPSSPSTPYEISVVYFRALYGPEEYDTPTSWAARHHLERSGAIKCPTVLLQLSGAKKIQQVLTSTSPDHLSSFLPNHTQQTLTSLRSTFAPMYDLADPNSEGVRLALDPKTAEHHVLKPQREGGGNNIYRDNIPPFLKALPESHYKQFVLMELIKPPAAAKNTALRSDGEVVSGEVISELGVYGTVLWKRDLGVRKGRATGSTTEEKGRTEILHCTEGGWLLRTKAKDSDEGGVAAGFSSLDSPILYE